MKINGKEKIKAEKWTELDFIIILIDHVKFYNLLNFMIQL